MTQSQSHTESAVTLAGNHPVESAATPARDLTATEQRQRWFLVGWLTVSTILNVIDKNTLAILGPTLKEEFGLSNQYFANLLNAFLLSYAIMYTVGGRLVDRFGDRICMTVFVFWWSISAMLHALARGAASLALFRFMLGIGEPGNYPAALRFTTRWFARDERGFPISIWSVGSSIGGLAAPPLIAFLTISFGWRMAFFVPGFVGLIWVLVWIMSYRLPARSLDEPNVSLRSPLVEKEERKGSESLLDLIKNRKVLAIVLSRFVSDGVWLFYISWTPIYLAETWGYNLRDIGLYAWIPFLFGAAGGIFGGTFSDVMIRRGVTPARARKRVLYTAGIIAPVGMTIGFAYSSWMALALIAVIAFIVYIWFINTAALVTDTFPGRMVASVLGLMGTAGTIGGMGLNWLAGFILDHYHSYIPIFFVAGTGHLLATLILFFFLRDRVPVSDSKGAEAKP